MNIIIGLIIIIIAIIDIMRAETDSMILFDWFWDFSRWDHPFIFWFLIICQFVLGLGAIFMGEEIVSKFL